MAGNIIVTTTVNKVTWQVDQTAYGKALKQVKSLKKEWEKVGSSLSRKNNPAQSFLTASAQAKLVAKRLAQTERAEASKSTAHAIALAKKEAAARKAIDKVQNARRKDAVRRIYNRRDPESQSDYNALRNHYKRLQKEHGLDTTGGAGRRAPQMNASSSYVPSGIDNFARPGDKGHDPELSKQQTAAMNRYHNAQKKEESKATADRAKEAAKRQKDIEKETNDYRKALARREVVVANAQRRLEGALGPNWRKKVKGFDSLSNTLQLRSGSISEFNSQVGQMIRQAKAGEVATMSLADGMKSLRRTLISVTAAYSAFNAGASILSAGQFFESTKATMLMVSDTTEEAGKKMEYVQDQAYRLGLDLKVASQGFAQMAISAKGVLSDSDTNKLFTSLSEFATASGADAVKYQRGITAIGQMLGKGQIMAEELKGQLSEALPGSMQAFVKAAQKYFKDDKIGVPELQELMKNGKLLAKDILPLVADELAQAARKNGALTAQMKSNRVAMERMRQSWMKFQAQIFEGGFGKEMTNLFNSLAEMMGNNGPAAEAIGQFAGGFVKAMRLILETAYDTFTILTAILQKFIDKTGMQKETLGKVFEWSGIIAGGLIFFGVLRRVLGVLGAIIGLGPRLAKVLGLFKGGQAAGSGGGATIAGGIKTTAGKVANYLKSRPLLGKIGVAAGGINAGYKLGKSFWEQFGESEDSKFNRVGITPEMLQQMEDENGMRIHKPGLMDAWNEISSWWSNARAQNQQNKQSYLQGISPRSSGAGAYPGYSDPQKIEGEIRVTIDAGEMQNLIDQRIEMSNMENINLIVGVPQN